MPILVLFALLAGALTAAPASTALFTAGQDGYSSYRIPAIVKSKKGTLLAFVEGRRTGRNDWGDIDILLKRSTDNGKTWSPTLTVADFDRDTIGNPAPVVDRRTGTIWLLLTRNPGDVPEKNIQPGVSGPTRTVWITHSKDDGRTWATPVDITRSVKRPEWSWYATGPVNGIQTKSGRLVIPCDHDRDHKHYSHVIYSDDAGQTWQIGGIVGPGANESTIAEATDGTLVFNLRSYRGVNRRLVAVSRDGGQTFEEPRNDDTLIEPICQGSLLRFGKFLLFSNPASKKRENMTVRLSRDNGKTWAHTKTIHAGPAAYSNLIELNKKEIGLLYERGDKTPYDTITFAVIPLKELTAK